ncbi:hypothetical protein Lser_V15G19120 [Lactuca serriola]
MKLVGMDLRKIKHLFIVTTFSDFLFTSCLAMNLAPYIMMTLNFDIRGFRPFSGTNFSSSESINFTADIFKVG